MRTEKAKKLNNLSRFAMREEEINSKIGHRRIKEENSTTYLVYAVLKLKNNPHNTRWSKIKDRIDKALKREFGEDIIW